MRPFEIDHLCCSPVNFGLSNVSADGSIKQTHKNGLSLAKVRFLLQIAGVIYTLIKALH